VKWSPEFGPEVKLCFRESARCEKEQSDESETQTVCWGL
jgi:hypothetical protein